MTQTGSPPPDGTSPTIPYAPASGKPGLFSAAPYTGPAPTPDDKQMGMLVQILGIFGFLIPLIIWLIKKDTSPFTSDQGKESVNFQITLVIAYIVLGITVIGLFLVPFVWIASVVLCIMAGMKAKDGIPYRYPFALRLIK